MPTSTYPGHLPEVEPGPLTCYAIGMTYAQSAPSGRKAADQSLRYEPIRRELPFLIVGQPVADLPIIRL